MSLRIWLPLNGNFKNLGLTNVSIINIGATVNNTDGKTSKKCYYFNGTNARAYANNISVSNSQMSGCCWVKFSDLTSSLCPYLFSLGGGGSGTTQQIGLFYYGSKNCLYIAANGSQLNTGFTPSLNVWYHFCFTYKGSISKLYVNGELVYTGTNANNPQFRNCFCIGARSNSVNGAGVAIANPMNGYLNDVRIYDHCLSQQQIKKISQGLILHYPFNNKGFGQPNFIRNSKNQRSIKNGAIDYVIVTFDWSQLKGNIVTFSADMKSSVDGPVKCDIYFRTSSNMVGNSCAVTGITGSYKKIVVTFMAPSSNETVQYFYVRCNSNAGANTSATYFCKNVKVELGNKATPWIPHRLDTQYSSYQLNNNKIIDISGFGNNGLITGTYTVESNSPVYKNALYVDYLNTNYHVESIELPILDAISVSFWVKTEKTSTGKVIFADHPNDIECAINTSGIFVKAVSSANGFYQSSFISNAWNHVVVIRENTNYKLFINGIEIITRNSSNNYWIHNGNLWLLNRDYNNNYAFKGTICDFRIYCTALTNNEVKELYEYHPEQTIEEESQE